jgi:drug/metabolite transporter (DMT)-like permease
MPTPARTRSSATAGGVVAILIWASCVAVARLLSESLGTFTSGAAVFLVAGIVSTTVRLARPGGLTAMAGLPRAYLAWCGALFVVCQIGLYGGLGLASDRLQVLEIGAVNYLWPAMTLVIGLPILGMRANAAGLGLGVIVACAGIVVATMDPGQLSLAATATRIASYPLPYALAFFGALAWSVYSGLARKLVGGGGDAVPLFLLASGVALLLCRLCVHEHSVLSLRVAGALVYTGLLVAWGAYALWDIGVRKGDFALLSSLSYAIPVLSTMLSCLLLKVRPPANLWAGVAMVTVAAAVCRMAVRKGVGLATMEPDHTPASTAATG